MGNNFLGLYVAKTGLFASQRGLELSGHNITNAGTEGYTRQRLNLSSIPPSMGDSLVKYDIKGRAGRGVQINHIEQVRDEFLDSQYRKENGTLGSLGIKADTLYYIEDIFNEPSDSGLTSVLNSFYNSIQQLSKTPESKDSRTLVKQNAISVCTTINDYAKSLQSLQADQNTGANITVKKMNEYIEQIADLNLQIIKYEISGEPANDLNDKRNLLLDELSKLVDISYEYDEHNSVSVYIGNDVTNDDMCIVDGVDTTYYQIDINQDKPDYYGNANKYDSFVLTSKNGNAVEITADTLKSGELKGYLDMRDGTTSATLGIPYILSQIDMLARGIAKSYNDVHVGGYGIPDEENGNVSKTGVYFFDVDTSSGSADYSSVNALNFSLSDDIMESVYNIAASDTLIDLDADNSNIGNAVNALKLAAVVTNTDEGGTSSIDNLLKSIVSEIGVMADHCNNALENQQTILDSVDYKRQSVSGVSIDEEMINVISFEKSYAACSRVITAIDEMLDKLNNGTGVVGR